MMEPEQVGIAILRIKEVERVSICEAADRLFARLATRPPQAQNPQGREMVGPTPAGPEAANGAHDGDANDPR